MRQLLLLFITVIVAGACSGDWKDYPDGYKIHSKKDHMILGGDKLNLFIFGEDVISGQYQVSQMGDIQLPLVGEVSVANKTVAQAKKEISKHVIDMRLLVNPNINLTFVQDQVVLIMGEALNAGEVEYKDNMTVLDVVAKAGGFSYRANQKSFDIVRRLPNKKDKVIKADISTRVQAGDLIRVRERYF